MVLDDRAEVIQKYFHLLYDGAPTECWSTLGLFKSKSQEFEVFSLTEIEKAVKWVLMASDPDALGGQQEVYARVLPIRPDRRPTRGKRGYEKDSAGTTVLWAELDLDKTTRNREEILRVLRSFEPKPTAIVFSGGGYHVYWKLQQFETDLYSIKRRTLGLTQKLREYGADDCYDLARILRVPGTWNLKYGEPIYVDLVEYQSDRVYALEDFPTVEYEEKELDFDFDEEPLPDDFLEQIKKKDGTLYKRITTGEGAPINEAGTSIDRSKNDWFIVMRLLELGYSRGQCLSVLTNPEWFSSAKTFRRIDGKLAPDWNYATRTIANAWAQYQKQEEANKLTPQRFFREEGRGFVVKRLGEEILQEETYLSIKRNIYHYRSGVFEPDGEEHLRLVIREKLDEYWSQDRANQAVEWIRLGTQYDPLLSPQESNLVNVRNGMLEITADDVRILPHSPDYKSFTQIPVDYDSSADTATVRAFFKSVLPEDAVLVFEEFLGTCLLTDYRFKKALLLVGDGDNGKSTLLTFIGAFLGGERNVSPEPLSELAGDSRFASWRLFGKLANIAPELTSPKAREIGKFKALTGGDIISAEQKGKDKFSFRNYAKLMFGANDYPQVREPDEAFFSRWIVIKCPYRFVDSDAEVDEARGVFKKQDGILNRLCTPKNFSATLNLAIAGLQRLLRNGKFTESESVKKGLYEFMARADSVVSFFETCSEPDPNAQEPKDVVYSAYSVWCNHIGIEPLSNNAFFRRVRQLEGRLRIRTIESTKVEGRVGQVNVLRGRRFKDFVTVVSPTQVHVEIPQPE